MQKHTFTLNPGRGEVNRGMELNIFITERGLNIRRGLNRRIELFREFNLFES